MASTLLLLTAILAVVTAMPSSWRNEMIGKGDEPRISLLKRRLNAQVEENIQSRLRRAMENNGLMDEESMNSYQMISAPSSEQAFASIPAEWKLALVSYLMDMQKKGHHIEEIEATHNSLEKKGENVVCKVSPYRVCYHMSDDGILRPIQRTAQPINTLRVY